MTEVVYRTDYPGPGTRPGIVLRLFLFGRLKIFSDCESDYDLPGPALHIDDTPSPPFYNSTTTVDESCVSSENVSFYHLSLRPVSHDTNCTCLILKPGYKPKNTIIYHLYRCTHVHLILYIFIWE